MSARGWLNRLRDWRRRRALRSRLDEELQFHLDELVAEHERRGLDRVAALRAARLQLGNVTLTREAHHEQAGLPWVEEWVRDIGLAVRNLRRRPGYAITVIGLLGVGLAAALCVYVITDAMLRRALPVPRPHELQLVADEEARPEYFSRATVDRLRSELPPGRMVAYGSDTAVTLQRGSEPAKRTQGQLVLGDALTNLGVRVAAGRQLSLSDDRIGAGAPVAVVAHAWAVREFGSAQAAVGGEIRVNRHPVEIVGVLEPVFRGFDTIDQVDLYFPAALQTPLGISGNSRVFASEDRDNDPDWNRENRVSWLHLLIRVPADEPGRVLPALQAAFQPDRDDLMSQLESPEEREGLRRHTWFIEPAPGGYSYQRGVFASTGGMLAALVGSLLLLTCANLSGIMLVRTLSRSREIGVRLSLGAGRWRACRMALVEALVCGAAGAALGLLFAAWFVPGAAALLLPGSTLQLEVAGLGQLGLLAAIAVVCSLACTLAPAWWISRLQPWMASKGGVEGGRSSQRLGRLLVAAQLALAVMLVAVSLGLGRGIADVLARDPGYAEEEVLTARFDPRTAGYRGEELPGLYDRLRTAALAVPGVERAAFSATGILSGSRSSSGVFPRGEGMEGRGSEYQQDNAEPEFLHTVGLRLQQGRWFEDSDREDSPRVAVVTEAFAQAMWGRTDVLGYRFGYGYVADDDDMTVIGVLANAGINQARETAAKMFYTPAAQSRGGLGFLAVRVQGSADAVRSMLVDALGKTEPGLVFSRWQTLKERREGTLRSEISASQLAAIIAGLALTLATFGVGGALAHLVALRQRELAMRMALGATPQRLLRGVLRDGLRLGVWGAIGGAGLVAALVLGWSKFSEWQALPGWGTVLAAAGFGVVAALLGSWWPAQRAARVDPLRMLKAD